VEKVEELRQALDKIDRALLKYYMIAGNKLNKILFYQWLKLEKKWAVEVVKIATNQLRMRESGRKLIAEAARCS